MKQNQIRSMHRVGVFSSCVATVITLLLGSAAEAQVGTSGGNTSTSTRMNRIEITGQGGWQFGGEIDLADAKADFEPGGTVGGTFGLRVHRTALALAAYHYQFSEVNVVADSELGGSNTYGMGIGYLQFGGELEFPIRPKVRPVAGLTLGAAHFSPDYDGADTDWFFAAALFGGIKFPVRPHFGIRVDMKLLVTVLDNDSDSLCIAPYGCATAIDVSAMAQGQVSGGVYLAF